jgi:hypothetical protein
MTASGSGSEKTSISLPTDLAEYARRRAEGNTSAYIASLIERDRRVERTRLALEEHGYVGELAITEQGKEVMRERLNRAQAKRAQRRGEQAA